jgi:transposase
MASYIYHTKNNITYIVESISLWNKSKQRPDTRKKYIGKIDKETGKVFFKQDFIDSYKEKFITIKGQKIEVTNTININNDINTNKNNNSKNVLNIEQNFDNNSTVQIKLEDVFNQKNFGLLYLLKSISSQIKLTDILNDIFKDQSDYIFMIISFLLSNPTSMNDCIFWIEENTNYNPKKFSSQRISELFSKITKSEINKFYKKWIQIVRENEFIALDITSISSYSSTIPEVEWGYNRNDEKLPQVNICLLYGEKTYLPMYQTIYSGSLNDVKTLSTTLTEFYGIIGDLNINLVMDKGFFSEENINYMILQDNLNFLISVPFTNNFVHELIKIVKDNIDIPENLIKTANDDEYIRGIHIKIAFDGKKFIVNDINNKYINKINDNEINQLNHTVNKYLMLNSYIYYNPSNAIKEKNKFYSKLFDLRDEIYSKNKILAKHKSYIKYFIESKVGNKIHLEFNNELINNHLSTSGYFILVSNIEKSAQYNYSIYRKKNVVEKAFNNWKQHLGLDRFHVHGHKRMVNKSFVLMLTQILYCAIYKKMLDNNYFKKHSISNILSELSKVKSIQVHDKVYIRALTKIQKEILNAFDIPLPDNTLS